MLFAKLTTLACLAATWFSSSEANAFYDVTCPGVQADLKCPVGQVIETVSVSYGNKNDIDCSIRDQPVAVSTNDCIEWMVLGLMIERCKELNHCILPDPDPDHFFCDESPDNFLQYTYTCRDENPDEKVITACEGSNAHLKCEQGTISIKKAMFGRADANTCTDTPSKDLFCSSYGAEPVVKNFCNGKATCQVRAISHNLGHPSYCDDLPKYLLVKYICE
ncbi:L-rhamnose-binding lectin CSL3-like [Antennarius striatus]|uniref:L-rhamnose-binding lectin CSL3-like n=1 Tax=Antennarius striatus TaxID=241820 RepID=UPI0035B4056B